MEPKQNPAQQDERFESDTQRLVHKHLSDPDHVFTEEEIASVRVGMHPKPDTATQESLLDDAERVSDRKNDSEEDLAPGAQKTTPWDTIEP